MIHSNCLESIQWKLHFTHLNVKISSKFTPRLNYLTFWIIWQMPARVDVAGVSLVHSCFSPSSGSHNPILLFSTRYSWFLLTKSIRRMKLQNSSGGVSNTSDKNSNYEAGADLIISHFPLRQEVKERLWLPVTILRLIETRCSSPKRPVQVLKDVS